MSEKTIETLAQAIKDVVAEDWIMDMDIDASTSFNDDLELESIEFVALAEKLQALFGKDIRFVDWLSGKTLEQIIYLTVGDVANFVESATGGDSQAVNS